MSAIIETGVTPLAQSVRNLSVTARALTPVLEALAEWGGATHVSEIVRKTGFEECDVRGALYVLESCGLAESRTYMMTPEGRAALQS